ncbi:MAG: ABC transporter ATP-binding protein [Candidatus Heimdallarchaeota archaeon]
MVEVVLEKLTKYFGEVRGIEDIDLHIHDKEFVALLGPSGCGKTTTLRCIAGLETPTSGNVFIGDQLVNEIPTKDRNVAMVFQNWALYPHMKVYDNIAFPLRMGKYPKEEIPKKVKEVAEILQIGKLLNRKPGELSGGQQQRVALGRAIVREPMVFLMDEPLSNLDAKLRVYMRAELKALQKDIGVTTIYVTHDQVEAMTMTDRIALFNEGLLQQVGTAEKIYKYPTNLFVGGFIGSPPMNFMPGSYVEKDGKGLIDAGCCIINVSHISDIIKKNATSNEVIFGIRPDDIILSTKSIEDAVQAKVFVTEPLGNMVIVDIVIDDYRFKAEADTEFKVDPGEDIWMQFKKEKMHIFDKRTEKIVV